jgi:hypothetical protein
VREETGDRELEGERRRGESSRARGDKGEAESSRARGDGEGELEGDRRETLAGLRERVLAREEQKFCSYSVGLDERVYLHECGLAQR